MTKETYFTKLFYEEVRNKKKTAIGAYHMRGKGVRHGTKVSFPYDFMTNKERKQLSGEVRVSFMYETIIPKAEFDLKDEETKKAMLSRWRDIYPNNKILKEMGIATNTLSRLLKELDVPKKQRGGYQQSRKKVETTETTLATAFETEHNERVPETTGMSFSFRGDYKAEQITRMLDKLSLLLSDEDSEFEVNISVREKV